MIEIDASSLVKNSLKDKKEISYSNKQNLLLDQGTLQILMLILKLIEFLTYNTLRCIKTDNDNEDDPNARNNLASYMNLKNYDTSKLERLPQTIAKKQLKKPMEKIM